jgi:hypothetical protein
MLDNADRLFKVQAEQRVTFSNSVTANGRLDT